MASANEISLFLLVLARVSGVVLSAPVLGDRQVPRIVKAALTIALGIVLVQIPSVDRSTAPTEILPFALAVLSQLLIGVIMGFAARVVFFALETAGGIVSLEMGLSMAAVLNPLTRATDSPLSQLYTIIAGMVFLAVRGDELVVAALSRSFDLAPLTAPLNPSPLMSALVDDALLVTQIGVQIAMPIAASLIAANVILGVISRSMPQLNLFMLSMPLNVLLGLLALIGSLSATLLVTGNFMQDLPRTMLNVIPSGH